VSDGGANEVCERERERERGRERERERERERCACGPMDVHVLHWVVLIAAVSALRRPLGEFKYNTLVFWLI